jgi:hypothetical protein
LQLSATLCCSRTPAVRLTAREVRGSDSTVSRIISTEKTQKDKDWADDDYDGLPNWLEDELGTDRFNPDTDGDGIFDGDEVFLTGTDPLLWDSNGNGSSDYDDWLSALKLKNEAATEPTEAPVLAAIQDTASPDATDDKPTATQAPDHETAKPT